MSESGLQYEVMKCVNPKCLLSQFRSAKRETCRRCGGELRLVFDSTNSPYRPEPVAPPAGEEAEPTEPADRRTIAVTTTTKVDTVTTVTTEYVAGEVGSAPVVFGETLPTWDELGDLLMREALARCQGNRFAAAEMIGVGKTTVYRKLKERKRATVKATASTRVKANEGGIHAG